METLDGTAEAEKDYKPIKESMMFEDGETEKSIDIEIIDDNEWELDEVFFVKLSLPSENPDVVLGHRTIQEIKIINDDGDLLLNKFSSFTTAGCYTC